MRDTTVQAVAAALERNGIPCALGGSGLLRSLGLVTHNNDWDLTTDAPFAQVQQALVGLPWHAAPTGQPPFVTRFRLQVGEDEPKVDLMGGFAIATSTGVCQIPTIVAGTWQGLPLGSPAVWGVAYRLMQRALKAQLLSDYLRQHGAPAAVLQRLLAEPLPAAVRAEVATWPARHRDGG